MKKSFEIEGTETVDELSALKKEWNDYARSVGYPDICWEILKELGKRMSKPDTLKSWNSGEIFILGSEKQLNWNVLNMRYTFSRRFTVWVKKFSSPRQNALDNIVMNSLAVMSWEWFVEYDELGEEETIQESDKNIFVNGDWILSVRDFIQDAQVKKQEREMTMTEGKRIGLLVELLAGEGV